MHSLKATLKVLNNKHFDHISTHVKEANTALMNAQLRIDSIPHYTFTRSLLLDLKRRFTFLAEAERQFYSQKAKIEHLNLSDKSTIFFHGLIKRNQKRRFIATILCRDGNFSSSTDKVAMELIDLFQQTLGKVSVCEMVDIAMFGAGPCLPTAEGEKFCWPISKLEIKKALFSCANDKALCPDGFSAAFLKNSWPTIGADTYDAILEFFRNCRMLRQMNHTLITLIPKCGNPLQLCDFRPLLAATQATQLLQLAISQMIRYTIIWSTRTARHLTPLLLHNTFRGLNQL